MINPRQRDVIRKRVHTRIREKLSGTAARPRLNVYRSLNHIYTQLIDDTNGVTSPLQNSRHGRADWITKSHMRHNAFAKESRSASVGAVDKLIRDNEVGRLVLLFQ